MKKHIRILSFLAILLVFSGFSAPEHNALIHREQVAKHLEQKAQAEMVCLETKTQVVSSEEKVEFSESVSEKVGDVIMDVLNFMVRGLLSLFGF